MAYKLTNIRLLGRYMNTENLKFYNIHKGRRKGYSTDHVFYYYRGKRHYISDADFYSKKWTMAKTDYFNYEDQEKGYIPFDLLKSNVLSNINNQIAYVDKRLIDPYRGYYKVEYGILSGMRYNEVFLDEYNNSIDKRDIVACAIKVK